jgi:cation diffusion facilitator CzcD-associated flavoprotein CzcO
LRTATQSAKWIRRQSEQYIHHQLRDHPELLKKMLPSYPMGCKRILLSNDFYRSLKRDNVSVVTSGIAGIEENGVRTKDGELIELDIIVYATGFRVLDGLPKTIGRGGVDLVEVCGPLSLSRQTSSALFLDAQTQTQRHIHTQTHTHTHTKKVISPPPTYLHTPISITHLFLLAMDRNRARGVPGHGVSPVSEQVPAAGSIHGTGSQ